MVVFWGTQSGTAKTLAKSLAREALARYNIKSMTADLDDYDHSHLEQFPKSKIAIFIVSTYGEGDPPDNALDFFSVVDQFRCSEQGEKILRIFASPLLVSGIAITLITTKWLIYSMTLSAFSVLNG